LYCELIIRTKDKRTPSAATDRFKGDVIVCITEGQIKAKLKELLRKKRLTQDHIDKLTNLKRTVKDITDADIDKATEVHWPWSALERKGYLITTADLSEQEIADLTDRVGYEEEDEEGVLVFVQTAFRKKTLDYASLTSELDSQKIDDEDQEYQPLEKQELSKSLIVDRNTEVEK